MKAGYNSKEGGLDFGCDHFSCKQMRQYSIDSRSSRDHYMQADRFLLGTECHGCHKLADDVDMKNRDRCNGAFIYFCDIGVQEKKTCRWYCRNCFEEEAKEEDEEMQKMNPTGRVTRGRQG